ncbi:vacuolar diacylglycerol pyrophosphate phosphatase [Scheffersomyces coipomensis]|uniref:vacuolar diacylglycerol pyrophosphate phosphatase n=1 Tax=Scheffersomyces coipomensis TaxID=1788519 RepID=UPI00315DCB55
MAFVNPFTVISYLRSASFQRFLPDWIVSITLVIYFFSIAEHAKPFERQFSLNDLTISYPFATKERVTGPACIVISFLVPAITITLVSFIKSLRSSNSGQKVLHNLQISILGLIISLSFNGVVTDILKNWIANPRPDFLERCGARNDTPLDTLVDISVCTAPYGQTILIDGMRSTPSGHSSISFSAMFYLSLWIYGQLRLSSSTASGLAPQPLYKYIFAGLPILLASYIALSRTQDYRHHFFDISLGSVIGIGFAITSYLRYYPSVWSIDPEKTNDELESAYGEPILPR